MESWRKLTVEVDAAAACAMDDAIVIRKTRHATTYGVDERGVRPARAGDRPARACSVEWTRLERAGSVIAFTLAFEAVGASPADLLGALQSTAAFVLRARPMPGICAASSQGYAAWVNALRRGPRYRARRVRRGASSRSRPRPWSNGEGAPTIDSVRAQV
ncbi:MAG: hypothetical protein JNL21_11700 [Myxococcales bacterium]|nr:hypothetical protein [Myxococcales bacterium]